MPRPWSGNRNDAPVFQAPRGHKGHTLFIVSFLIFSTVLSDLYPLSLSAIPGPSGERTVRIRKVKGSNPSVSTKKKDRLNACPFLVRSKTRGIRIIRKPPMWLASTSANTGRYLYSVFPSPARENGMQANPSVSTNFGKSGFRLPFFVTS